MTNEIQASEAVGQTGEADNGQKKSGFGPFDLGMIAYICYGIATVFALVLPIVGGLIIAYVNRDDAQGTWIESHYTWLIRTFWLGLLLSVIAMAVGVISLGLLWWVAFVVLWLWMVIRIVNGFRAYLKKIPLADPESLLFG